MAQSLTAILAVIYHEILLFAVVGLAIGGTDDFLVDIMFLARRWWRNIIIYSRHPRMTTASLPQSENPGRIAIFVPAWGEADVIGPMLRNALSQWRQGDYRIFVGVYPNDRATLDAVIPIAEGEERLIICINERPGPTTKADCLNLQWRTMMKEESRTGVPFKAIVLHDAEDVVHADEIRLFDLMIDRFQLVQLPVLPLPGHEGWWSRAIANHYCDEFAESHGKYLTIREAMGASVPSAGVACAFERATLDKLIDPKNGGPFDPDSLTEDYEVGLRIKNMGGRGVFVRMRDGSGELVATREYFPDNLDAAVKQKARWMVGISLAGWARMGWQGGATERWMRIRDRRAAIAAFVLLAAYLALLLWGVLTVARWFGIVPAPRGSALIEPLLWLNFLFMVWRLAMRAIFVGRSYGWRYGLGAIPRSIIANLIAMMAARRAIFLYLDSLFGKPLVWDKTQHRFPQL
ncbi:glycosyl transferase family protein [Sphingobium sp. EP60837]|uniref:glycosyl transferase family protein n=1 Tax=Sphingobium sp. EP60837 TaxID=1855519 RepID=UPI0007DD1105|nr:glycosyl transferase family protein [Sphingobium sp. EP60837]ANI78638.1 Bacteriophage N4 adsorption protein [Sphingobium sp. EP60837]